MKKILLAALLALMPGLAFAQVVKLPIALIANGGAVVDLGSGPLELRIVQGAAQIFTSQGSGLGATAASTAVTLAATPTTPPCVGCFISGGGIPANTTVAAFNGTTGVTLSAAATTTTASELISWGAACPATIGASFPIVEQQANIGADLPLNTQAHICGASQYAQGALVLPFTIGAH